MVKKIIQGVILIIILTSFVFGGVIFAQENYPTKPVKIVVGYAVGGSTDVLTRLIGKYVEKYLGQNIVVVNITGGGGAIGAREVLEAKPDGYTVLIYHQSIFTGYHTGVASFNFDDFTPVCRLAQQARVIHVKADAPWENIRDLIEDAKKHPGKIKIGANIGATSHFQIIPLQIVTNNAFTVVATGGDTDRITKNLGGHIDLSPIGVSSIVPYLESGKLRALAVLSSERDPYLPDVPTYKELGLDYSFTQDWGVFLPPKTPENIVKVLSAAFQKAMADPECIEELKKFYIVPKYEDTEDYVKYLYKEDAAYYYLAKVSGLKPKMEVKK